MSFIGSNPNANKSSLIQPSSVQEKTMDNLKEEMSALALSVAKEGFGIDLNYSQESIKDVENILGIIHDEYKRTQNDEGIRGLALEFAAYIIKVIENNFEAGIWERDHPRVGHETFPYTWRGGCIFPYGWCLKRIFDGESDNVWFKFQVCIIESLK